MQQGKKLTGKKLTGKKLGFLSETCSQAQAYLGIPQTFFGSSRQSTTKIQDSVSTNSTTSAQVE